MEPSDAITIIGDRIVEIDELSTTFDPDDPRRAQLDAKREALNNAQRELARRRFNENTSAYQNATARLSEINGELESTLADVNRVVETIATLNRFLGAVNSLINTAVGILP
jgi:uncharacterized protein involved in exopolysaccharide biosynthesis